MQLPCSAWVASTDLLAFGDKLVKEVLLECREHPCLQFIVSLLGLISTGMLDITQVTRARLAWSLLGPISIGMLDIMQVICACLMWNLLGLISAGMLDIMQVTRACLTCSLLVGPEVWDVKEQFHFQGNRLAHKPTNPTQKADASEQVSISTVCWTTFPQLFVENITTTSLGAKGIT